MSSIKDPATLVDVPTILRGGLAGLGATVPMTAAMLAMQRLLPGHTRYPLPPEQITLRLASDHGALHRLKSKPVRLGASLALHLGFGGTVGALFALLGGKLRLPVARQPIRLAGRDVSPEAGLRGIIFALGVWAGSYLGWIPALGILSPATRHPTERNILMIVAHVVWGACAGLLFDWLTNEPADQPAYDFTHTGVAQETAALHPEYAPET